MNPDLRNLQPYPFEKLTTLKHGIQPNVGLAPIALSIGEPKHTSPAFVLEALQRNLGKLAIYPTTKGLPELRESIANWAMKRFHLNRVCPESQVLPVSGTREALFSFTQAVIDRTRDALVVSPNPFYQIYEGAAILAGAHPHFLPCRQDQGFLPDFDTVSADIWDKCQLLFICSPGNPTGSVIPEQTLHKLIAMADKHDFIIASDECYSEIYCDESRPPVGLLQACQSLGREDYARCVVFHSLSKRSNLPGLRSGFVAGDATLLARYLQYRTYHGAAMPIPTQLASIAAWNDETHVKQNRDLYRQKFAAVLPILQEVLEVDQSDASFYLWPKTPISDIDFAQRLFQEKNVTVLPGQFLSRTILGENPGEQRIRLALVASVEECIEAAKRIRDFTKALTVPKDSAISV